MAREPQATRPDAIATPRRRGLLTGTIAIHDALYAYRMHGGNSHSNATVPGGAYNSSTREWEPIRIYVLQTIQTVLRSEAAILRRTFGEERHAKAEALVASVVGVPPEEAAPPSGGLPDLLLGKAANLLGSRLSRLGLRGRS